MEGSGYENGEIVSSAMLPGTTTAVLIERREGSSALRCIAMRAGSETDSSTGMLQFPIIRGTLGLAVA